VRLRKIATLAGVVFFGSFGDVALARGMKSMPPVELTNLGALISALANPWVVGGIVLLLGFFSTYLSALSFADLTYVLPATSVGYVIMALLGRFFLHEHVSAFRWTGVALITLGVGFVAGGPAATVHHQHEGTVLETIGRNSKS
jgi:drug/metabolite transporter (DMT)-like permease